MKIRRIKCIPLVFIMFGCDSDTTSKEARDYCECVKEYGRGDEKCIALIGDFKIKYQFSEEAQLNLAEKMKSCLAE